MLVATVYDLLSGESGPIWLCKTAALAMRQFRNLLSDVRDFDRVNFELYVVATYDPQSMKMEPCSPIPIAKWSESDKEVLAITEVDLRKE